MTQAKCANCNGKLQRLPSH